VVLIETKFIYCKCLHGVLLIHVKRWAHREAMAISVPGQMVVDVSEAMALAFLAFACSHTVVFGGFVPPELWEIRD